MRNREDMTMTFFSPGANSASGQRSGDTMVVQAFPCVFPAKTPKTSLKKSPSLPSPPPQAGCHKAHNSSSTSIQKKPSLSILNNPSEALAEIRARHGAAPEHVPAVRLNGREVETGQDLRRVHAPRDVRLVREDQEARPGQPLSPRG